MSKFQHGSFIGGYDDYAVNAEKYTEEEAIKIFEEESYNKVGINKGEYQVSQAFVKWRAGISEDNEPCVGWWIEYEKRKKGSCPAWVFHRRNGSRFEEAEDE